MDAKQAINRLETLAIGYEREGNPYADECAGALRMGMEALKSRKGEEHEGKADDGEGGGLH